MDKKILDKKLSQPGIRIQDHPLKHDLWLHHGGQLIKSGKLFILVPIL